MNVFVGVGTGALKQESQLADGGRFTKAEVFGAPGNVWMPVECRNVAVGLAYKSMPLVFPVHNLCTEAGHLGGCCRRQCPARQQNLQISAPISLDFPLAADADVIASNRSVS